MADRRTSARPDAATAHPLAASAAASATAAAEWTGSLLARIARAWHRLPGERRVAAALCVGLFVSLFLPWYRVSVIQTRIGRGGSYRLPLTQHFTGWGAFSFVEGAVLLVAVSVLVLLFRRAEGRAFHLPGGDGTIITLAGAWTCFLVVWRMFDKQGVTRRGELALSSGIEWGIFVALLVAAGLAYAGTRIRVAREPEPPLPTEDYAVFDGRWRTLAEAAGEPSTEIRATRRQRLPRRSESTGAGIFGRPPGWLSGPPDHAGAAERRRPRRDEPQDPPEPQRPEERGQRPEERGASRARMDSESLTIPFEDTPAD